MTGRIGPYDPPPRGFSKLERNGYECLIRIANINLITGESAGRQVHPRTHDENSIDLGKSALDYPARRPLYISWQRKTARVSAEIAALLASKHGIFSVTITWLQSPHAL